MKIKTLIFIALWVMPALFSYAKSQSGIYLSLSDYKNNKLSYETDCKTGKHNHHIHLHDFFWGMPEVKIIQDGKKYTYRKNELYGYRDCDNEVYRFYNNTTYRIAQAGNIYIYTQEKNITQGKGFKVVDRYYFSANADGKIIPLTVANLKSAYIDNKKFIDAIDERFNDDNIAAYDKQKSTFKVNYVFSKTIE